MQTDAQKRAKNKYDSKTYTMINCKVKKETAAAFKEYAASNGTTVNALISEFVAGCLADFQRAPADDHPGEP